MEMVGGHLCLIVGGVRVCVCVLLCVCVCRFRSRSVWVGVLFVSCLCGVWWCVWWCVVVCVLVCVLVWCVTLKTVSYVTRAFLRHTRRR